MTRWLRGTGPQSRERLSLWTAAPLYMFYWAMYPAIYLLNASANAILRVAGQGEPGPHHEHHYSREELKLILHSSRGQDPSDQGMRVLASAVEMGELDGLLLDRLDIEVDSYSPSPAILKAALDEEPVEEKLVSHLLKSNCLVTGQPDWASVQIHYSGPQIDQESLLKYLIGFREHNEFHEQCVERIFVDILRQCQPQQLAVYARYTRRGGLDINPWRSNFSTAQKPPNLRGARQ